MLVLVFDGDLGGAIDCYSYSFDDGWGSLSILELVSLA